MAASQSRDGRACGPDPGADPLLILGDGGNRASLTRAHADGLFPQAPGKSEQNFSLYSGRQLRPSGSPACMPLINSEMGRRRCRTDSRHGACRRSKAESAAGTAVRGGEWFGEKSVPPQPAALHFFPYYPAARKASAIWIVCFARSGHGWLASSHFRSGRERNQVSCLLA
jgi:hypothetical protein